MQIFLGIGGRMLTKFRYQYLFLQSDISEQFTRYSKYLQRPADSDSDFFKRLLAGLFIVPALYHEKHIDKLRDCAVSFVMISISQDIHNQIKHGGDRADYQIPVLLGDYVAASALRHLVAIDMEEWTVKYCNAYCNVNEARAVRSQWCERSYVPESERLESYSREYSEYSALAASIAATVLGLNQDDTDALCGFAYYAAVLCGMQKENFFWNYEKIVEEAKEHLAKLDKKFANALDETLLQPILSGMPVKSAHSTAWGINA